MKRRVIAYNDRMKIKNTLVVSAAVVAASCASLADGARISISPDAKGMDMPKTMYGIFFEDINYAADGGIYPELLANRGFDWKTKDLEGWEADYRGGAMARITVQENAPLHPNTARHLRMECFGPGTGCGVRNKGFHGVSVEAGKKYDLTFYARGLEGYAGGLRFVLEDGQEVVCEAKLANGKMSVAPKSGALDPVEPEWRRHSFVFAPQKTVRNGTFSVLMDAPGIVELEQVSLFPQETFNGRRNGLRKDLVQLLKDLKPGVLRFPGGCVAEGDCFERWFDWKRTVGALERRETIWNTWGYWQSFGLGYYEYFCLAEDIGAEPLPICLAGITCQFRGPKLAPLDSMDYFAQSICDLVDFANADPKKNKWGALRAEMGHPKPFNLKMVGVGNENWGQDFLDRYLAIAKIVREKHPEIKLVSTAGASPIGGDHDLAWYAGEYACHVEDKANSLFSALCEAVCMMGFERNCDVVEMSSYAPLFGKIGCEQWKPDLIWFDNLRAFTTPNYHVQKMFGNNLPSVYIPSAQSGEVADFHQVCGFDKATGEYVVKCVNLAADHALDLVVDFGVELPAGKIKVETLTGNPKVVNDMENPERCRPEAKSVVFAGGREFKTNLPASSLTIIRAKK